MCCQTKTKKLNTIKKISLNHRIQTLKREKILIILPAKINMDFTHLEINKGLENIKMVSNNKISNMKRNKKRKSKNKNNTNKCKNSLQSCSIIFFEIWESKKVQKMISKSRMSINAINKKKKCKK